MSETYINALMSSYKDSKKTKKNKIEQNGGKTNDLNDLNNLNNLNENSFPCGGFPPILQCKTEDITKIADTKNREFINKPKDIINIKDIMQKRRDPSPFI